MARFYETVAPWLWAQVSSRAASALARLQISAATAVRIVLLTAAWLSLYVLHLSQSIAATLSEMQCLHFETAACLQLHSALTVWAA